MITTFLYTLSGGMLAVLPTGPTREIAWRFLRLVVLVPFALSFGSSYWHLRNGLTGLSTAECWMIILGFVTSAAGAILAIMAPLASRHRTVFLSVSAIGGLAGVAAACAPLLAQPATRSVMGHVPMAGLLIGRLSSAFLLGTTTVTWLLGHAYLTATNMTLAPLRHFSRLVSWSVGLRIAFVLISLLVGWLVGSQGKAAPGLPGASLFAHLLSAWLIVSLRLAVGLVAVAIFAYMISDCVRLRATQSATGILYFCSIFVYIGELASQQLTTELGWPV